MSVRPPIHVKTVGNAPIALAHMHVTVLEQAIVGQPVFQVSRTV